MDNRISEYQKAENNMDIKDFLVAKSWKVALERILPETQPTYVNPNSLQISSLAKRYLAQYDSGIYRHQAMAIAAALQGKNICISTATASGKSLVFYTTGIELLQRTNNGTVLAIYPLKALTDEQEQKWLQAVANTRANIEVGRIDGSVASSKRKKIISNASVVIMTPDVMHAWMLSNLAERGIKNFLANLQLVVIDEAHTYSGVFGSNSAYLFRRVHHLARQLGASPRYIAASATINDPQEHMRRLTGLEFSVIGSDLDSSGRKARRLLMVEPPTELDILSSLTDLMRFVTDETDHRFITFVDSRKQTEQLASVMRRSHEGEKEDEIVADRFERLHVYPYRAGYEPDDRKRIEENLRQGAIRGVISTSALELGVDLPDLTLGILYGLSNSATSYFQRIGRVGRHRNGTIVVVNNGSVLSNRVFRNLDELDRMPLTESTLYLDNRHIQYIHAMCLARPGGEHDVACNSDDATSDLVPRAPFPQTFLDLCNSERIGEIEPEFQAMKGQAGNNPNYTYPLRDCDVQFRVLTGVTSEQRLGTLSFSQMMREAYPGAVYYHMAAPYRVWRIKLREHQILTRPEKRYTTKPNFLPALIFPNLTSGNVYGVTQYGSLVIAESNLQIKERISGFRERRGPNEFTITYPLDASLGYFFDQPHFTRNYFSSGVIFMHPALNGEQLERDYLSELLFESFLMQIPFERQDVNYGADSIRADRELFRKGDRFICIYDQTYGSLRLTNRLMDSVILKGTFEKAIDIAQHDSRFTLNAASMRALESILKELERKPELHAIGGDETINVSGNLVPIIMPGSIGLSLEHNNEEFKVEGVLYTPTGLRYRGRRTRQESQQFDDVLITMPAQSIVPIPDVSQSGYYDLNTGEVCPNVMSSNADSSDDFEILAFE